MKSSCLRMILGAMLLCVCSTNLFAQVVWVRTGPFFYSNGAERKPTSPAVEATPTSLSSKWDDGKTNKISWSEPPAQIVDGQQVTLTMESSNTNPGPLLFGQWVIRDSGRTEDMKGVWSAGSFPGARQGGDYNKANVQWAFKPAREPAFTMQVGRWDDYGGNMGMLVTWKYVKQDGPPIAATQPYEGLTVSLAWRYPTTGLSSFGEDWPIDFDKAFDEPVTIVFQAKLTKKPGAPDTPAKPINCELFYDDVPLPSVQLDDKEVGREGLNLPESTPVGHSVHKLRIVATMDNLRAEKTLNLKIERGLKRTLVAASIPQARYFRGDPVTISGVVRTDDTFQDPVRSKIEVTDDSWKVIGTAETDENGMYTVTLPAEGLAVSGPMATLVDFRTYWTVKALPLDKERYATCTQDVKFEAATRGALQCTINLDGRIYKPDQPVNISGVVTANGQPRPGVPVHVLLDGIRLLSEQTDAQGQYVAKFSMQAIANASRMPVQVLGYHTVVVVPEAPPGEPPSPGATSFFNVQEDDAANLLRQIEVTEVTGKPTLSYPPKYDNMPNKPALPELRAGAMLSQGETIKTTGNDVVVIKVPFENGATATFMIDGETTFRIGQYSQGPDGKVKLRVLISQPGQVQVNVTNPNPVPLDYQVVTVASTVTSVKTKYTIKVDRTGQTRVDAEEGEVLVTPRDPSLKQISLTPGQFARVPRAPANIDTAAAISTPPPTTPAVVPPPTVTPEQQKVVTIQIPANRAWTSTGITLDAGTSVKIEAAGIVEAVALEDERALYRRIPPQGRDEFWTQSPQPGLRALSLIGRIGNGPVIPVGPAVNRLTAGGALGIGELVLGINDDSVADNSGAWSVRITVSRDASAPAQPVTPPPPVRPPDPPARQMTSVIIMTAKSMFDLNEAVVAIFTSTAPSPRDTVVIAPIGSPEQIQLKSVSTGGQGRGSVSLGDLPRGFYEVRYLSWSNGEYRVAGRFPFSVDTLRPLGRPPGPQPIEPGR